MQENINEQIKIAELDKLLLEAKKIKAEKIKIEFETKIIKKEDAKIWWKKDKFWQQFATIIISISILGFYISYIIIPTSSIDNIKLELDNQKKEKKLYAKEEKLQIDSLKNLKLLKFNDSLRKDLDVKAKQIIELSDTREKLDSTIKDLVFAKYSNTKTSDELQKLKNLLIQYKKNELKVVNSFKASNDNLPEEDNPYRLLEKLEANGFKFMHMSETIGVGTSNKHSIKDFMVVLPEGATILKTYQFVTSANGDGPLVDPWPRQCGVDLGWLIMNCVKESKVDNEIRISVRYDNWRHNDACQGFLIVCYK